MIEKRFELNHMHFTWVDENLVFIHECQNIEAIKLWIRLNRGRTQKLTKWMHTIANLGHLYNSASSSYTYSDPPEPQIF